MKIQLNEYLWVSVATPSYSGIGTQVYLPFAKTAIDCGTIEDQALNANTLLLTHGHADHCGCIGSFISRRELSGNCNTLTIYAPDYMVEGIRLIAVTHAKMANMPWDGSIQIKAIPIDDFINISDGKTNYKTKAYKLSHSPESYGFAFYTSDMKPMVATVFDTDISGLEANESRLMQFPYIICESTMMGPSDICIKHHHLHMENAVDFFAKSHNLNKILFMHFSKRYSNDEIILKAALASPLHKKIILAI